MVERVEGIDADAAPQIWIGTFHAFGLELLRLHHKAAGLPQDFRILDEAGALAILEESSPTSISTTSRTYGTRRWKLRSLVRAISRAKDEMVGVDEYEAAARATHAAATNPDERIRGEKTLEVARAYRIYEEALRVGDVSTSATL